MEIDVYEQQRKDKRRLLAAGVGLTIFMGVGVSVIVYNDPEAAFQRTFTGEGKCLANTPYDTDRDAALSTQLPNTDLAVVPANANDLAPAVLRFTVDESGVLKHPEFIPADDQTAELMAQMNCPTASN